MKGAGGGVDLPHPSSSGECVPWASYPLGRPSEKNYIFPCWVEEAHIYELLFRGFLRVILVPLACAEPYLHSLLARRMSSAQLLGSNM